MNQLAFIVLGFCLLVYILIKVKNKQFSERESLMWILAGAIVLIFAVFPGLLDFIARFLGVYYQPTALFLLTFFAIILILLRKEQQINCLEERVKELAQQNALIMNKMDKLIK